MLRPIPSSQYIKDFKRIVQSPKFKQIEFINVITMLMTRQPLPAQYHNHPLMGGYNGYWDCHIGCDCVLIYKIENEELLLARIGTHSELFR